MKASEAHNQAFRLPAMNDYWAACQGAGLIISAPLCFTPTLCCAEKLGVPWVPVALGPVMPTGERGRGRETGGGGEGGGRGTGGNGRVTRSVGGGGGEGA